MKILLRSKRSGLPALVALSLSLSVLTATAQAQLIVPPDDNKNGYGALRKSADPDDG